MSPPPTKSVFDNQGGRLAFLLRELAADGSSVMSIILATNVWLVVELAGRGISELSVPVLRLHFLNTVLQEVCTEKHVTIVEKAMDDKGIPVDNIIIMDMGNAL